MDSQKKLGDNIKKLRDSAGLTQDELADKADLAYSTVAKIEQGVIKAPSVFTVADIAKTLQVPLDDILHIPAKKITQSTNIDNEIRFVYCDINGVLVRFYQRAFVEIAESTGLPIDKIETLYMHFNDAADRGEIGLKEFDELMSKRLGLKSFNWKRHYMNTIDPIRPMGTCLKKIAKDVPVGLISNTREGFIETLQQKGAIPKLNYAAVMDSSKCGTIKPENKMFELAERAANVPPKHILLIDDSRANLMAAEARGWHVIWFDAYHPSDSIKRVYDALNMSRGKK